MRLSCPIMDISSSEWSQQKSVKMLPASRGSVSGGVSRKQAEVLSGMIVWNVLLLGLLLLAVCVPGEGGAVPSNLSPHQQLRRSAKSETVKKGGVLTPEAARAVSKTTVQPQADESNAPSQSKETQVASKSSEETSDEKSEEGGAGDGVKETQPVTETKDTTNANATTKDEGGSGLLPSHLPNMSTDAVLRGFYVFVGIGVIILIYIVIKMARLRKRRAAGKYRVLSHSDDQEMFPLAAGEGDDEEIFNAAHHQPRK